MKVDGVEVVVEGAGTETIVMIHGWPDTFRLWDRQVESLRASYRCIRFTLPGFEPGHPRQTFSLDGVVEVIRHVVEQACGDRPVTLLLHDFGCFFGYQFALRHPQFVKRVVGVDVGDAGSRRHLQELSLKAKLSIFAYQLWLAAAWRISGPVGDWMARRMAAIARAPADAAEVSAQMGYPYYVQWAGAAGGYRKAKSFVPACPMLFIYGKRKPFMFHSSAWAGDIASRPGCQVLAFDTGHWVMVARPAEFNSALTTWLAAGDAPD